MNETNGGYANKWRMAESRRSADSIGAALTT
jgi:hypothetical protein